MTYFGAMQNEIYNAGLKGIPAELAGRFSPRWRSVRTRLWGRA